MKNCFKINHLGKQHIERTIQKMNEELRSNLKRKFNIYIDDI